MEEIKAAEWHYANENRQKIKTKFAELHQAFKDGKVKEKTLVWRNTMDNWKPIQDIPDLYAALTGKDQDPLWYYVNSEASQEGPVSKEVLKQLKISDQIDSTTFGWKEGMDDWIPLSTVPELAHLFAAAPNAKKAPTLSEIDLELNSIASATINRPLPTVDKVDGSVDGKADAKWFYVDKYRAQKGPTTLEQLKEAYMRFEINDNSLGWREGMPEWKRVSEIDELKGQLGLQPLPGEFDGVEVKGAGKATGTAAEEEKKKEKTKNTKKRKGWTNPQDHGNVYVTGLPLDITVDEVKEHFKKAGIIKEDPFSGEPKIKLYTDPSGKLKGDARIGFLKPESVGLAIKLLDESQIRVGFTIKVSKAQFQMKGKTYVQKKLKPEESKSVVRAKLKEQQGHLSWDEDGIADNKGGLKIVVLKYMFTLDEVKEAENFYEDLKAEVGLEIEAKCGKIEKITIFENNADGVIAIRFDKSTSAEKCIQLMNGRWFAARQIECSYFDGVTDYRVKEDEREMEKRLKEFGEWLEGGTNEETDQNQKVEASDKVEAENVVT